MKFHILTIKKDNENDIDFEKYSYDKHKYNKLSEDDWVIFHRSRRGSEIKVFYFYGAAQVGEIKDNKKLSFAHFKKILVFNEYVTQNDLNELDNEGKFSWTFKSKKEGTYEHFFNQYGMTEINKIDFLNILKIAKEDLNYIKHDFDGVAINTPAYRKMLKEVKIRLGHSSWAEHIKMNQNYLCAITGIKMRGGVDAAHLASHSAFPEYGQNKNNGIALLNIFHKAYDEGFLTFSEQWEVKVVKEKIENEKLLDFLIPFDNKKLNLGKNRPDFRFVNIKK